MIESFTLLTDEARQKKWRAEVTADIRKYTRTLTQDDLNELYEQGWSLRDLAEAE